MVSSGCCVYDLEDIAFSLLWILATRPYILHVIGYSGKGHMSNLTRSCSTFLTILNDGVILSLNMRCEIASFLDIYPLRGNGTMHYNRCLLPLTVQKCCITYLIFWFQTNQWRAVYLIGSSWMNNFIHFEVGVLAQSTRALGIITNDDHHNITPSHSPPIWHSQCDACLSCFLK